MEIDIAVEGRSEVIFLRTFLGSLGVEIRAVYGQKGIDHFKRQAAGFAVRGRYSPILLLADFCDIGSTCVVEAVQTLVPDPPPLAHVRLAVRELESWILASRSQVAQYFGVSAALVPLIPDAVEDPKRCLVNLARRSPYRRRRAMFVPIQGHSGVVGKDYLDGLSELLDGHWDLDTARSNSPSLERFIQRFTAQFGID